MKRCNSLFLRTKALLVLWWMSLFLFLSPLSLLAQTDYSIESVPNVRLKDALNHVSNPDQILSTLYVDSINQVLCALEDSTGIEVAVVALKSIGKNEARKFAFDLFNHWGIGKKGEDNGLLLFLVTDPDQRAVVFETGYGIEDILPDATCYTIQQKCMLPAMKRGNYDVGMLQGIRAAAKYLYDDEPAKQSEGWGFWDELWFVLALILIIFLLWIVFYILPQYLFHRITNYFKTLLKKMKSDVCPECGKKTLKYQGDEITRKSTVKTKGEGYEIYVCKSCGYTKKEKFILSKLEIPGLKSDDSEPKRKRRSTEHSRPAGRRSGSSWGGGSSGGGGSISRF